jgi:bifunctional non-homologous end joining protein LigD
MPVVPAPMLATAGELPAGADWAYEFKWDGVRALAVVQAGALRLYARSGAEITKAYPELHGLPAALAECGITDAVLDGEIVLLDGNGRPDFVALAERMHVREVGRARQRAATQPVDYMIFDVLRANGGDLFAVPYVERRELLDSILPAASGSPRWSVPPNFTDGPATLEAALMLSMEGVVAKRLSSVYRAGTRSPDWVKIKHELTGDYVVGGWRVGRRALGALLVGTLEPAGLIYRGRVGGGITASMERTLLTQLTGLRIPRSPFVDEVPREDTVGTTWVQPTMVVEVRYGNLTRDGRLRFPRFVRLRPDKSPEETHDA